MTTGSHLFPSLQTERLQLIEIKPEHAGDMFRLFSDDEVKRFYHVMPFKSESDLVDIIDMLSVRFREQTAIRWGVALKGSEQLIGNIGFNNFTRHHRASVAYALLPGHWGNGYTAEALKAVVKFGFERLELNRIEAEVMPGNNASVRVLEKNGFRNEGLLREWILWYGRRFDVNMYSLLRADTLAEK